MALKKDRKDLSKTEENEEETVKKTSKATFCIQIQ